MMLRLRLGPPLAPYARMLAENSGLSMAEGHHEVEQARGAAGGGWTDGTGTGWGAVGSLGCVAPNARRGTEACQIGWWAGGRGRMTCREVRSRDCDERVLEVKKPIYGTATLAILPRSKDSLLAHTYFEWRGCMKGEPSDWCAAPG